MPRLTKTVVEKLRSKEAPYFVWDDQVIGFGVRVMPSGTRTYQVQYRKGGRSRRSSIGRHGVITAEQARTRARELLGLVAMGRNPVEELAQDRKQPNVTKLCERFLAEHVSEHCKPTTVRNYRQLIEHFIIPALGPIKVKEVERKDVADLHHMVLPPFQRTLRRLRFELL